MKRSKKQTSICLWEEPPVSPSALLASGPDLPIRVETLPYSFADYLKQNVHHGFFGRMSPVFFHLSQMTRMVVNRHTAKGLKVVIMRPSSVDFRSAGIVVPGGSWTLNISEYPNDAVESSLSDILETTGDHLQRYFLSPKACAGILRRAEKRGRKLPPLLHQALEHVARMTIKPREDI